MKIRLLVLFLSAVTNIVFSQNQWQVVNSNVTSNLNKIIFVTAEPQIGYIACDSGKVLKTTDTGRNWSVQNLNPSVNLKDVEFMNSQTGWVTGASSIGINVYKTTNGGNNWTEIYNASDATSYPTGIHFKNEQIGFIVGGNRNSTSPSRGFIIRTTNGGMNWARESWNLSVKGISFRNADNGWMITWFNISGRYGEIYKTTNAGVNWDMRINTDESDFTSIFHKAENQCWAFSKFFINQNQYVNLYFWDGNTWHPKWYDIINFTYTSVYFYDSLNGYICSDMGHIRRTTNGGASLIYQYPIIKIKLNSITMLAVNKGFAVGNNGKILTNSISVGIENIEGTIPEKYSLNQNYPNPFNPTTKIKFSIPSLSFPNVSIGNPVTLKVYDVMGREIQTLVNERLQPGTYEATFDGSTLNSGVYFYKLVTDGFTETKRMMMIR